MPGFHLRFVGRNVLPKGLSARDVEESFALSADDLQELKSGFRGNARIGAAYHLVMLRATGGSPDGLNGIPKALLVYTTSALSMRATNIASLASLYKDAHTSGQHKAWARNRAGFQLVDDDVLAALLDSLHQLCATAISVDDLVKQGEMWLFEKRRVLPHDRLIRDLARQAFAAHEAAALNAILSGVPAANRSAVMRDLRHHFVDRLFPAFENLGKALGADHQRAGQVQLPVAPARTGDETFAVGTGHP